MKTNIRSRERKKNASDGRNCHARVFSFDVLNVFDLFFVLFHQNARFVKELHGEIVGVGIFVHDPLYAAVDDEPCADGAGLMGAI